MVAYLLLVPAPPRANVCEWTDLVVERLPLRRLDDRLVTTLALPANTLQPPPRGGPPWPLRAHTAGRGRTGTPPRRPLLTARRARSSRRGSASSSQQWRTRGTCPS